MSSATVDKVYHTITPYLVVDENFKAREWPPISKPVKESGN